MKTKYTNVIANISTSLNTGSVKQSHKLKLQLNRLLACRSGRLRHSFLIPCNNGFKKEFFLIALLFSISSFAQEINYKEYSYTEFFKLIENEKDTIFKLQDALIKYNPKTDTRFRIKFDPNESKDSTYNYRNDIVINKHLVLNNVQFYADFNAPNNFINGVLVDIHFKKSIEFLNVKSFMLQYCRFNDRVKYLITNCDDTIDFEGIRNRSVYIQFCDFDLFNFNSFCDNSKSISYYIMDNNFRPSKRANRFIFSIRGSDFLRFEKNLISNVDVIFYSLSQNLGTFRIRDNLFDSDFIYFSKTNFDGKLTWTNNKYSTPVFLELDPFSSGDNIDWDQFNLGFSAYNSFVDYSLKKRNQYPISLSVNDREILTQQYRDSIRIFNSDAFAEEMSIKSQFYNHYKSRYNTQQANKVYLNIKDFETQRLKVEYNLNPGFRPYFKWKVNQFLKLFSDYGTEPSKAIIFSMYVILLFAFVYLLFPNSWDAHGRKRIMNRYAFFFKYMNKKAGIHEVYLDNQKEELLEFDEFKTLVEQQGKTVPRFFTATALPLYKWAISGTKFSASVLKRVDIMKGTWSDLPQSKRIWKSVLLISAFTIAICYDILIKMLNALMLSINTFTTLGFGEIPIKGLPRYLAIIQGFIGWFMLTIFSVSLISQLLN